MFRFSRGFRGADFGTTEDTSNIDDATEKSSKTQSSGTGIMSALGVGDLSQAAGLCSCMNKDKAAQDSKKKELAQKYPYNTCNPNSSDYQSCVDYNAFQKAKRDKEFNDFVKAQDLQTSKTLSATDKEKFGAFNMLIKGFLAKHPEAAGMTVGQARAKWPDDFDAVYAEVQKAYPFLKPLEADTAINMSPGLSDMKLGDLSARLDTITKGSTGTGKTAKSTLGTLGMGAAVFAVLFAIRKR